ncbi:MAG TPA: pirin family protein [Jatrophihabitantaceae bacterium]|nr:pirin family protein [Jatrophihabitantaceae bacterium]
MSNLDRTPALTQSGGLAGVAAQPVHEVFTGREVTLGDTQVRRLLPNLGRRLVGAWCFVDHYGPQDIATEPGMQVPAHPHMGLQTVSWLLDGEVHHRDSIGSDQLIRPGELGLMTSGNAIAHTEQSPVPHPALLHGVQLWVALPDAHRASAPAWDHHADLPIVADRGLRASVILGSLAGAISPGRTFSALVGADLDLSPGADALLPLEPDFEHAVLVMSGWAEVDDEALTPGAMLYLGSARRDLRVRTEPGARVLLLGGEPFGEQIVMWWNFVARTNDEVAAARAAWETGTRFGTVAGFEDNMLVAPPIPPGRLKPGGSAR